MTDQELQLALARLQYAPSQLQTSTIRMMNDSHDKQVRNIRARFCAKGIKTKIMPRTWCPFDLLLGIDTRVEVKVSDTIEKRTGSGSSWHFNIHRHGVLSDERVDFYILCIPAFSDFGFKAGIRVIVPSEIIGSRKGISISARSLINQWSKYLSNWKIIDDAIRANKKS